MENCKSGKSLRSKKLILSIDQIGAVTSLEKLRSYAESIRNEDIDVALCEGSYKYADGFFAKEISLFCCYQTDQQLDAILLHAESANQESCLLIDESGSASLFYLKNRKLAALGIFRRATKKIAQRVGSYTILNGRYFVAFPSSGRPISDKSKTVTRYDTARNQNKKRTNFFRTATSSR
jgi:hypothetical protein